MYCTPVTLLWNYIFSEFDGAFGGEPQAGGSGSHMGFVHPNDGFPTPPSNFEPGAGQFPGYNPPNSAAPTPTGGLPDVPTGLPSVPSFNIQPSPQPAPGMLFIALHTKSNNIITSGKSGFKIEAKR
jgi:hypothetical protein